MLEPAARSLADGHGDAPNPQSPGVVGGVADPGENTDYSPAIELREEEECMVLLLDTEYSFEAWRDQVMRRFGSDTPVVNRCLELSLHLDVGKGKVDRFDLRRMAHLLTDEFHIEVQALRCADEAVLAYAESELKMKIIVQSSEVAVPSAESTPAESTPAESTPAESTPEMEVSAVTEDPDSQGIDPVEFEDDDDSLEIAPIIESCFEEADLEPVTPVLVMEEPDEAFTTDVLDPVREEDDEPLPAISTADENVAERITGPSQGGWVSRPLVREEHGEAGERQVMVVTRTLRSGARISYAGDVVVYGDVNAGAQVEAEGNIIVLGALRGHAHAGARGDEGATILAFDLRPTHLRIAHVRACIDAAQPESGPSRLDLLLKRTRVESGGFAPELAYLCEGSLRQETYSGRIPNS